MSKRRRGRVRAASQGSRLGQSIRVARGMAGFSRAQAAQRAGIARSTWDRLEAGSPSVTLATIAAATEVVGLDLVCQTFPGRGPSLRDTGQLAIAERLRSIASPTWRITLEERAGDHGEAIDLVLWGPTAILAVEIERLIVDWQAQYRRASIKRTWLAEQASRAVRLVIVIEDTGRNRAATLQHVPLIQTVMPIGRTVGWRRAVLAQASRRPINEAGSNTRASHATSCPIDRAGSRRMRRSC